MARKPRTVKLVERKRAASRQGEDNEARLAAAAEHYTSSEDGLGTTAKLFDVTIGQLRGRVGGRKSLQEAGGNRRALKRAESKALNDFALEMAQGGFDLTLPAMTTVANELIAASPGVSPQAASANARLHKKGHRMTAIASTSALPLHRPPSIHPTQSHSAPQMRISQAMPNPALSSIPSNLRFLITGGARGLGRGLSRLLLQAGHDVFILDNNAAELRHTLDAHLPTAIEAQRSKVSPPSPTPGKAGGSLCDVSSLESVRKAMAQAKSFHRDGQLDVVVNNAGKANPYWADGKNVSQLRKGTRGAADDGDDGDGQDDGGLAEWNEWIGTNLTGAFLISKEAVPLLAKGKGRERAGSLVHISSARAKQSEPNQEGYAASKAGMLGLNHALASSLSRYGIRSNAILPGWFPSLHESQQGDDNSVAWDAELTQADREQFWTKRAGKIEDLAQAVLFCASNGFFTGQEIVLDGGMEKKMIYVE